MASVVVPGKLVTIEIFLFEMKLTNDDFPVFGFPTIETTKPCLIGFDIEEFFNRKATGNRVLAKECTFCAYKKPCWENLQYLPQKESKAMNPKYFWYTKVKEENVDSTE